MLVFVQYILADSSIHTICFEVSGYSWQEILDNIPAWLAEDSIDYLHYEITEVLQSIMTEES